MEHICINPAATSSQRAVTPYGGTLSFNAGNSEVASIQYMTISLYNILGSSVMVEIMTLSPLVNPLAVLILHSIFFMELVVWREYYSYCEFEFSYEFSSMAEAYINCSAFFGGGRMGSFRTSPPNHMTI